VKNGIHPKYVECNVTCGCGEQFVTRATTEVLKVEICSKCHPYYTGKQKLVDTAGRVEKFRRRYASVQPEPEPESEPESEPEPAAASAEEAPASES